MATITYRPDPRKGSGYGMKVNPDTGVFGHNFFERTIADENRITTDDFVVAPVAATVPIRQYRSSAPEDTGRSEGGDDNSYLNSLRSDLGLGSSSYPTDEEMAKESIMDALMSDPTYSRADKVGDAAGVTSMLPAIGGLSALANLGAGAVEVNRGNEFMEAINAEKMGGLDAIGLGLNPFRGAEDSFVDRAYQAAIENPNFFNQVPPNVNYSPAKGYGSYDKMADAMYGAAHPLSSVELTDAERALGSQPVSMSTNPAVPLYSPQHFRSLSAQEVSSMYKPQLAETRPSVPTAGSLPSVLEFSTDPYQSYASMLNPNDPNIYTGRQLHGEDFYDFLAYDPEYDPTTGTLVDPNKDDKGYAYSGIDPNPNALDQTISAMSSGNSALDKARANNARYGAMDLTGPSTFGKPMDNFSTHLDQYGLFQNTPTYMTKPSMLNQITNLFSPSSTSDGSLFGGGNYDLDASGANRSINQELNTPASGPSLGYGYGGSVESASRGGLFGPQAQAFQAKVDQGFNSFSDWSDAASGDGNDEGQSTEDANASVDSMGWE